MSTFHKENETGYNACSSFYDSYLNPTVAIDELFFPQAFADVFHQNVLEVGCGTGRHTIRLLDAGNTVTGIDISEGMLSKLKEKIQDNKLTLIHGDFLTDHIPNAPFDSIVTSLVLEHIDDLNTFFSISRKVLKPFGYLYISDIHPERTAHGIFAHFKNKDGTEVHLKSTAHRSEEISKAALQNGFAVKTMNSIHGTRELVNINPKWLKYLDQPMIQIWILQLTP